LDHPAVGSSKLIPNILAAINLHDALFQKTGIYINTAVII
jgi:hypothetical protein